MLDAMNHDFTPREMEILSLMYQGLTHAEIAARLFISRGTVKAHSHNIYSKLGVANRTQAIIQAQQAGLLQPDQTVLAGVTVTAPVDNIVQDRQITSSDFIPFIGRKTELARLSEMLSDDRVCLITILGTGGIGKTRLAMALAQMHQHTFRDGSWFVALNPHRRVSDGLLESLGLRLQTNIGVEKQVLSFLKDKQALVVLDNMEHLLQDCDANMAFMQALLSVAPHLRIVVTSRQRLSLSTEIVYVLGGLDYVGAVGDDDPLQSEAVRLLYERARYAKPDFRLRSVDLPHIRRICHLTEGMPLALIMAMGWLEMLTLAEIAEQLSQNLDLLESSLRDLPARQRSIRATIESSWDRLSPDLQAVFIDLTVFDHDFSREAAQRITGVTLNQLHSLVNRSQIVVQNGRYSIHGLLRQFVHERGLYPQIHEQHSAYYATLLYEHRTAIVRGQDHSALTLIQTELHHIRQAMQWAVQHQRFDLLEKALPVLGLFHHMQSRYLEGMRTFSKYFSDLETMASTNERDRVLGILAEDIAYYYIRLGQLDEAEASFRQAQRYQPVDFIPVTDPLVGLSLIAAIRGNYDQAWQLADVNWHKHCASGSVSNQGFTQYALAGVALARGQYMLALEHARQSVHLAQDAQDRWLEAHCLFELAHVLNVMGQRDEARDCYRSSYTIYESYGDLVGMASASRDLAQIALLHAEFEEAEQRYRDCMAIYHQTHDQGGLAAALDGLGYLKLLTGDYRECRAYLGQAVQIAREMLYLPLLLSVLLHVAELRLALGQHEAGLNLLNYVQQHPSSNQETRNRAAQLTVRAGTSQSIPDLDALLSEILHELQLD